MRKIDLNLYPEIIKQWHPTKNPEPYNFETTPHGLSAWWKCDVAEDHEWQTSPNSRQQGTTCPCCSQGNRKKIVNSNCLATTHPEIAKQWHSKNELTPNQVSAGSKKLVWWKCDAEDDHEWQATIKNIALCGQTCPCCQNRKLVKSNSLAVKVPELAKEWHPNKNGELTSSDVMAGGIFNAWWICPKEHEWQCAIHERISGRICCFCKSKESKGERKIRKFLENKNINFKYDYRFPNCRNINPLSFDFVISTQNKKLAIEFQGKQHYKRVKQWGTEKDFELTLKRDKIKKFWCEKNMIPFLAIPYWEYDNIEIILEKFITENAII